MCVPLLLAWIPQALGAEARSPALHLFVDGTDGAVEAAWLDAERPFPFPLPLLARSPLVVRAVPDEYSSGVALLLEGARAPADVVVESISHAADSQVLIAAGVPVLVGPPRLPWRVLAGERDVLGELARQDGVGMHSFSLRVELPLERAGLGLVLIGRASDPGAAVLTVDGAARAPELFDGRSALVLEPAQNVLTLGADASVFLDQLFLAAVRPLEPGEREPLETRVAATAEVLRVELETPQPKTGTATLLVSRRGPAGLAARPREASHAGTERSAGALFVDRAAQLGLALSHLEGPDELLDIRPTMGPGLALGDVDGDGFQDLYALLGGGRGGSAAPKNRLLRNDAGQRFVDVTDAVGGGTSGRGMGALFFDGEGDGDLDLYVANYGADVLFANMPGPKLVDVSQEAGVGGDLWSAGVAASDYDRDGDLDLFVTSYLVYDPALMPPREELAYQREDPVEMLPFAFPGQRKTFLRNESDAAGLRFADATEALGLLDEQGRGMQAVFFDFDRDGDEDLYLANDVSPNKLWRNEGNQGFRDVSFAAGVDDPRGSMGIAIGDVERDGDEDLFVTNWQLEANALYLNNLLSHKSSKHHVATFRDGIVGAGLAPASIGVTSWGAELFDADADGDLDLFYANGYTSPDYESTSICVGQPKHFFRNDGRGRFRDASREAGPDLQRRMASRAALACDWDQDGDLDLFVTNNNGPFELLQNELPPSARGRFLRIHLRGRGGNTFGIGAEVRVRLGERTLIQSLRAGTSYLGGNPPELYVGLGALERVDELVVRWPSGRTSSHAVEGLDRLLVLNEPE